LGSGLLLVALGLLLWACLQPPISLSDPGGPSSGDGSAGSSDGGSSAIVGLFTISGCSELSFPASGPRCVSAAPASLRLVLLAVGATMHRFQVVRQGDGSGGDGGLSDGGGVDGGEAAILDETSSRAESPAFTLGQPGTYQVTLGVAGPGGTDTAVGVILVVPVPLGSSCDDSAQCQSPSGCICGRGASCPGALSHGLCSQGCDGKPCPDGTACIDLSRSSGGTDAGTGDAWRQPLCVPSCGGDTGCRSDFLCRELPILKPGERAGGAFSFGRACFAEHPGEIGASCNLPDGSQNPTACALGSCLNLGLRGLCSAACTTASDCPSSAACAAFTGPGAPAPASPRCVARCDAMRPCADPLTACQAADASGGLGFTLPGAAVGTTVCTPKRCTGAADCPGGSCVARGTASFCTR
jgi:hypothetical protein